MHQCFNGIRFQQNIHSTNPFDPPFPPANFHPYAIIGNETEGYTRHLLPFPTPNTVNLRVACPPLRSLVDNLPFPTDQIIPDYELQGCR